MGLGEFAKPIQISSSFEGLRNHHESVPTPESVLRKETRLWAPESECKFCSSSKRMENFSQSYQKLLDILKKFLSSSKENITLIFFWKEPRNFEELEVAGPFPDYFYFFEFEKGAEYEIILRDWRRWH